jgi:DNA-binding MarR family transcriptional regulator
MINFHGRQISFLGRYSQGVTAPPDIDRVDRIVAQWRRARPDLDPSAMQVVGRISRLHMAIEEHLLRVFSRYDLGRGEFDVLATLRRSGAPYELTAGEIGESTMVTSGAVSKRVDRLECAGLVARRTAESDARGRLVRLTDRGREVIDAAATEHTQNESRLVAGLTTAERDTLVGLLRKLAQTLPTD